MPAANLQGLKSHFQSFVMQDPLMMISLKSLRYVKCVLWYVHQYSTFLIVRDHLNHGQLNQMVTG